MASLHITVTNTNSRFIKCYNILMKLLFISLLILHNLIDLNVDLNYIDFVGFFIRNECFQFLLLIIISFVKFQRLHLKFPIGFT